MMAREVMANELNDQRSSDANEAMDRTERRTFRELHFKFPFYEEDPLKIFVALNGRPSKRFPP